LQNIPWSIYMGWLKHLFQKRKAKTATHLTEESKLLARVKAGDQEALRQFNSPEYLRAFNKRTKSERVETPKLTKAQKAKKAERDSYLASIRGGFHFGPRKKD